MPDPALSRRTVIVGGALAIGVGAAACAGGPPADAPAAAAAGTALGPTSDVPVGSARIFDAQGVVVTQATAGTFAGFSTVCPHQGCAVAKVEGASIVCPCHGSEFGLDGGVTKGPSQRGLTARAVTVKGTDLTVA
jgi:nitrite reductase/ring-hydroxylating ferredoxin subunit